MAPAESGDCLFTHSNSDPCPRQALLSRLSQSACSHHQKNRPLRQLHAVLRRHLHEPVVAKHLAVDENAEVLVWAGGPQDALASRTKDLVVDGSSTAAGAAALIPIAPSGAGQPYQQNLDASKTVEAERRQLTVMFCDLVGSTALSTQMDPEDLRDLITSFQDECREAIRRYDGFIARYMGDGLLVYFGYPQAHENDAERATRAGLDIVESMASLNAGVGKAHGAVLAVRVGVATGPGVVGVMIGEGAAEEAAVVGETPNLAARLQGVAQPNQVVISPATQRIVGDLFTFDDLGTQELKGIAEPVHAWRVTGAADIEGRHETRRQTGSSPLVGRQEELGLLLRAWEGAREGRGQVVLLQGEAGVGKSRLLEALREPLIDEDYTWVSIRCSPYFAGTPLYPVIEHFRRVMDWQPEDDVPARIAKLEATLRTQSLPLEEVVPLFAELMSLPLPEDQYPALAMTPQQKREATLDAITGWLFELAESQPVLQVCENLHWADPTTLEPLELYIEQSPTVSMLNVFTYRPEFVPPWSMRSHMTPITLNRLERPEVETFVGNLAQGKSLPREVLEHIVSKADGVPLDIEELTKTILESGLLREEPDRYLLDGPLAEMQIPSTLQDSLMARLDRAPALREVAQMAAVLGREFAYEMLNAVIALEETVLQSGLEQLVDDELLYQRGRPPRARYTFKHALIRDSAYQSLLYRTRQQHHQRVAQLLESQYQETGRGHTELIAQHLTAAGDHAAAVEKWKQAGQNALSRSALREAIGHFSEGLSVLGELPQDAGRDAREVELQLASGGAFQVAEGFGSPAAQAAYERALELCRSLGDTDQLYSVQMGLWRTRILTRPYEEAMRLAGDLLARAKAERSVVAQMIGEYVCGFTRLMRGELARATEHFDIIMRDYRPEFRDSTLYVTGHDPHEAASAYQAWNAWLQGRPERARSLSIQAVEIARASDRPPAVAHALMFNALVHQLLDEPATVLEHVKLNQAHCAKHDIKQWEGLLSLLEAWCNHRSGGSQGVTQQMKQGIAQWAANDGTCLVPYVPTVLIDTLTEEGEIEEALTTASEAIRVAEQIGEHMSLPELHRRRISRELSPEG